MEGDFSVIKLCIADACDSAGVRYEFQKKKTGFVVCYYRSEKKADRSTDKEAQQLSGVKDSRVLKIMKVSIQLINGRAAEINLKYPSGNNTQTPSKEIE